MPVAILRRLLLVSSLCAASLTQAETWPGADWSRAEAPSSAALEAFSAYAFPPRDDVSRQGIRTDALLVIRDGQIIYERYAGPTKARPHGLCLDKGDDYASTREIAARLRLTLHLRPRKPKPSAAVPKPAAGASNAPTPGSIVSAACSCAGKKVHQLRGDGPPRLCHHRCRTNRVIRLGS